MHAVMPESHLHSGNQAFPSIRFDPTQARGIDRAMATADDSSRGYRSLPVAMQPEVIEKVRFS